MEAMQGMMDTPETGDINNTKRSRKNRRAGLENAVSSGSLAKLPSRKRGKSKGRKRETGSSSSEFGGVSRVQLGDASDVPLRPNTEVTAVTLPRSASRLGDEIDKLDGSFASMHTTDTTTTGQRVPHSGGRHGSNRNEDASPWTGIDTLDDVRRLAQQTKSETHFQSDFEDRLLETRRDHVQLLSIMRERTEHLAEYRTAETAPPPPPRGPQERGHPSDFVSHSDSHGDHGGATYVKNYADTLESIPTLRASENRYIDRIEATIRGVQSAPHL
ncbi:uncharacterized protein KNAG_0A03685 [Huiozyma naganishii CBS 8797]|uniref:Uncharacterized protein n=1 Tax=Huiozyma naganishii (strain ATCC MYA-139 / BCRC 22969 / CBS 8797 / KCTC 17520 / NBRC 10181 / NCYC 3082 / Yp74L-3) TaxID=1071383 RepID=J7S2A2_HUIN7|nr:hypothetical protein KNAG_0A03685 [Kazachstania naganishii CBS 8797]CCK68049.1 hypothetical protein KNAG_0A03685 [Kazachstania naganishii CBS 8797]